MKTFKIWLFAATIFLVICLFLHSILLCVSIVEKIQDRRRQLLLRRGGPDADRLDLRDRG